LQNLLTTLAGGLSPEMTRPALVHHWPMIHALLGPFGLLVTSGVR
jgi:hypothetical protein